MNIDVLRNYMRERIPLSTAMGVEIVAATTEHVTLAAPLAPNVNHQGTVFGGSASAVALLSAWALLHVKLTHERIAAAIVVKKYTMTYERPMPTDFTATSSIDDAATWSTFMGALKRRGRARITTVAMLACNGDPVGELEGEFVALRDAQSPTSDTWQEPR